jgi:23S rRNA pseudouridine2605 synthase
MRLNRYIAFTTGHSRRNADKLIAEGKVFVNGSLASIGTAVQEGDKVTVEGKQTSTPKTTTIMLHKPVGYVCSRDGQGSKTVYELLPQELSPLKPVGRLDKDSSGLLLLTNDGNLANQLTHPRYAKQKIYKVTLNKPLPERDRQQLESGVQLEDGPSSLSLSGHSKDWHVTLREGRNRQIRRTFEALGYRVTALHRTHFGPFELGNLKSGTFITADNASPSR